MKTEKEILVAEYKDVMNKLNDVVPSKELKDHLIIWLTHKLTIEEKIREANLLLQQYNKRKPNRLEHEINFIVKYLMLKG
jgi:hypothetical protein